MNARRWLVGITSVLILSSTAFGELKADSPQRPEVLPTEESDVLMGMKVEPAVEDEGGLHITATGSMFTLRNDARILCSQRIPRQRMLLAIQLPKTTVPWTLADQNDFACRVAGNGIRVVIQGDSLIIIKAERKTELVLEGLFKPAYWTQKDGRYLLIDHDGGFGVYPTESRRSAEWQWVDPDGHRGLPPPLSDQQPPNATPQGPWRIMCNLNKGEEVWVSLFPPRPYNWHRSFEPLAHEGSDKPLEKYAYPSDELIRSAARFCKVFTVHSFIWPGGDHPPWRIPRFVPSDQQKFERMCDSIHQNNMKLVFYLSPRYYSGQDLFGELRRVLAEYKADGFYFDGVSRDFRESYRITRHARRILGDDRILYVHCSTDPLGSRTIYCPFIDTYADFILRGEAGFGTLSSDAFMRWVCSGYNISNSIGYWCHYGTGGQGGYDFRVPTDEDINAALDNRARIFRAEGTWKVQGNSPNGAIRVFDRQYYSKLEQHRQNVESREHPNQSSEKGKHE